MEKNAPRVLGIRIPVVLVPEKTLAVLLRPARVAILLAQFGRLVVPRLRYPSGLHRRVLVTTVALLGNRHDRGINHLPTTRHVALGGEVLVKTVEQLRSRNIPLATCEPLNKNSKK